MESSPRAHAADETRPPERNTRQRRAIRDVFAHADRPLSTEEVLTAARAGERAVSLATVYRAIRGLVDEGWLATVELPGHGAFYEVAGKAHHHHFSCVTCRRLYELEGCVSTTGIGIPHGFRPLTHEVTIYGICASCAPSRKRVAGTAGGRARPPAE